MGSRMYSLHSLRRPGEVIPGTVIPGTVGEGPAPFTSVKMGRDRELLVI